MSDMAGPRLFAASILLVALLSLRPGSAAHGSPPGIDPQHLTAAGRHTAAVTISEPGRYAITATSGSGTALQLIDLLAGPGEIAGRAGERDGRLDLLLDRGIYRLTTLGAQRAAGEVGLELRPFVEVSTPQPPLLVEGKALSSTLQDLEQRSWWLRIDTARRVILEVAGRNLADLRLFRDGGWLIDAAPARETIEPEAGRPLEPGLYLLTAFGGEDEPWPAGGKEHPLHLRFGVPSLGETGRTRYRVGPFGADRFVVPGSVNFVQLELPEVVAARLTEAPFPAEGNPFGEARTSAEVTKKSREPVASLEPGAQSEPRLITVRAAAGQPYVLQHFELRDRYSFQRSGRYWIGSVHSGHPQDAADATAIVTTAVAGGGGAARRVLEPFLSQAIEIDAARGWARRCNLLDTLTVFFHATAAGDYEVLLRGSAARARFEPFLVTRPQDYREPALKAGGSVWKLASGWHVLTIVPDEPGIVEAAVRPVGKLDAIWDLLAPNRPLRGEPVRPAVTFPAIDLEWKNTYSVHLNTRPGVRSGLVLRELPIDLVRPLPLALRPGEEIAVAARVPEAGTIRAETESGESLELRAGAGPWLKALETLAATLEVRVRNTGAAAVLAALRFDASRLRDTAPLPVLPPGQPFSTPQFPPLAEDAATFFDLERFGTATFAVRAAAPAFHTLESTGLLATRGTLRSRYLPALAGAAGGGTGRNFLVGSYLREGEYQLTVAALGQSRGHLGVRMRRAALRDGGTLREGSPSRVTVGPAEGVAHEFEIAAAGVYRLEAAAAGRPLPCRLEDADGWPIETPGIPAQFKRRFEPGRYRLLLLPEAVGSRRVTLLERVADPPLFEGHGPHPLALELTVGHTWAEPAGDAERTPDRWEFALPAPATLTVALTGEMQGEIRRRTDAPEVEPLARIQPGRAWSGRLAAADYTLATVCSRRNNHAPYEVTIRADELVAGTSRAATAPVSVPVSIGAAGLFEFTTSGNADVRARLTDAGGTTIAEQQDRPDDWNVQLAARLGPGTYLLELAPTGAEKADTRVALRAIAEREEPPLALPGSRDVRPGDDVAVIPLAIPAGLPLLLVRAAAAETVGLAVEYGAGESWTALWSELGRTPVLELPLPIAPGGQAAPRYRLRLWSLDRRGSAIHLTAAATTPPRIAERDLVRGVPVAILKGTDPPVAVAEIALDRPGLLRLADPMSWRASGRVHRPLAAAETVASRGTSIWVAAELAAGAGEAKLQGARVVLTRDEPVSIDLPAEGTAVVCDIEAHRPGPLLVTASAAAGRPGVAIVSRGQAHRAGATAETAAATATSGESGTTATPAAPVGERATTALSDAAGPAAALLWRADPAVPAAQATLRLFEFAEVTEEKLAVGQARGTIDPAGARRFALPRGDKRLHLALGRGLAAALVRGGLTESVRDAGAAPLAETVETAAEALLILNAGSAPAPWSIEILPLDARERSPAVSAAAPRISRFTAAGTARITIAPDNGSGSGTPLRLRTSGAEGLPTFLARDGRMPAGTTIAVGSGGELLLPHGRGLAAVWVERPGEKTSGLWGDFPPPRERAIGAAGLLRLAGPSVGLTAEVSAPSILHLSTADPLVVVIRRPEGPLEDFVQLRAAPLDLFLAPGATSLWLRTAEGGDLRGSAEVLLSPVTAIGEGPGPELLLAPGATQYFSFAVARTGPVGIGVRAAPDTATCTLLDSAGRTIGAGIVQMPNLAPGSYLLAVQAPADGGPVTVRPALAGIVPPGSGPPEDVLRRYLRLSRGEPENEAPAAPASGPQTPGPEEGD
ncbi:MAG: hypothetical protein ACYC9Y_08060 [Candidatus Methylomirabilia bacterium]